jgi:ABC-2 type transport system ATP-binding protein
MLQFENVKKQYGSFTALDIESFTIDNGLIWLIGENGSGKTTLLKMIAGVLPFDGDIKIDNQISIRKQRRHFVSLVNYAETEPTYPDFLTAKELVKLYAYSKKGSIEETEELLRQLHIFDSYNNPISTYSSGMVKKLGIALAFCGNPKWILLDEPLATTDVASVEIICNMIKQKHAQGTSFIITSHQAFNETQISFTTKLLVTDRTIVKQ